MNKENSERLKEFLKSKGLTQSEIAKQMGKTASCINQLLNGKDNFGKETALEWSNKFGINFKWLMFDEEPMLSKDLIRKETNNNIIEVVEDLTEQIKVSSMVPVDLVRAQNVRIWDFIERHKDMYKTIPDMLIPNHDLTHEVRSNALSPAIEKGDYLFLQHLDLSTDSIVNGHIYFIDTKPNGIVIKKVYIDDGKFVCYSLYGKRPVKTYTIDDIFDIFSIVGMIKLSITTTDDRTEQKEQQFDKLIDTNRDLIGQNTKLIDEMAKQREMMERMMESRNI